MATTMPPGAPLPSFGLVVKRVALGTLHSGPFAKYVLRDAWHAFIFMWTCLFSPAPEPEI